MENLITLPGSFDSETDKSQPRASLIYSITPHEIYLRSVLKVEDTKYE